MRKLSLIAGLNLVLLAGCAQKAPEAVVVPQPAPAPAPRPLIIQAPEVQPVVEDSQAKALKECRQELEAMQLYSKASYNRFQAEFKRLNAAQDKYLRVKDSIGTDIDDVLRPQNEFQTRELCFRVKSRLVQLMVRRY